MPKIERRDFLKLVGAGSVGVGAGYLLREQIKHPQEYLIPNVSAPEDYSPGVATWYHSVCNLCAAGCGIAVKTREGRPKKIEGNPAHPVSQGKLCARGQAGLQILYNPDRITGPMQTAKRGSMAFEPTSWEESLSTVAARLDLLRAAQRGDRIGLLTEGVGGHLAGLFEQFMGQLGSDRLLHHDYDHPHALYAANQRLFGQQQLPYYDLANCEYLLSFGADYLGGWISPVHHGLSFGHSRQGRPDIRGRFVQIEPRMSVSGAAADEWIAARPGTEGVLALGIAHRMVAIGRYGGDDRGQWITALADYSVDQVAEQTGLDAATITRLADAFSSSPASLAIGGGAAANHSNGVDTLVAVNALNYLAGNLGQSGGMLLNPAPVVQASHPRQASLRSMLELAEDARQGRIDVLIINGTNPVFTLPKAARFEEALAEIPLIVSLSSFMDETTALADIVLPSHTYLESWRDDFPEPGVGFPTGSVGQPVVSPLYDTRDTGDIILGLARKTGLEEAMPWTGMEAYLKDGWRQIYQRASEESRTESFDEFWRAILKAGVWGERMEPPPPVSLAETAFDAIGVSAPQFSGAPEDYPFVLQPYVSNSLHDGRAANLPWMQELPDPMTSVVYGSWVEMNPSTAAELGLVEGDLVDVESPHGRVRAPVFVFPAIRPEVIAMPIGQGHREYGRYAKDRGVNPIQVLAAEMEPHTGALASSATRVNVIPTGRKVELLKTGGKSRDLGRNIVQTTQASSGTNTGQSHGATFASIPIVTVTK